MQMTLLLLFSFDPEAVDSIEVEQAMARLMKKMGDDKTSTQRVSSTQTTEAEAESLETRLRKVRSSLDRRSERSIAKIKSVSNLLSQLHIFCK